MPFGRRKAPPIRSLIGEGTLIHGPIRFADGLRIDGEVQGDVLGAGEGPTLVVISEKAKVTGMVKAAHVIINGSVTGPVESEALVELQPLARVTGSVHYELLEMHPGALIDGELRPLKNADRPALKLAASNDH
ncbi:MAG: bactofilin family protein [Rubrivivax sp.]|jgi:cytoskeletal protein CcmA (bactofilin family)